MLNLALPWPLVRKPFFRRLALLLLIPLLLAGPARAADVLRLQSLPHSKLGLEPWVTYRCDGDQAQTLAQVRHLPFQQLPHPHIALGFRRDACWLHWVAENHSDEPLALLFSIDYPVLDEIDLYVLSGDRQQYYREGDARPFWQRMVDSRNYVIPQDFAPGERQEYFLRVKSSGSMTVPLYFVGRDAFIGTQEIQEWSLGVFYGISLGLLGYHLFLWVAVREKIYRFYVLHVGTSLLYMATLQGLAYRLWPDAIDWNNRANYLAGYTLMLTGVLFARDYLNTAAWRRGDHFLLGLAALLALSYPAQLLFSVHSLYAALAASAIVTMLTLLFVGLVRWRQGLQEARLFVLAWGLFLVMATIFSIRTYGFLSALPIPGVINVLQLGIILQQSLLSLGLASRLNTLKAEKVQREQEVLRERREREAKGDFLAKMSHEIRTPMNAVLGLGQLLRDSPLDNLQRRHVELLYSAGESLLDLINDILDYSKISAGKLRLEQTPFHLRDLICECASMFTVSAEQKSLQFIFRMDDDVPAWASGDPVRLRQVLNNLLGNAIKFTPSGEVELRVQRRRWYGSRQFTLAVSVRDTGIGLPTQALGQLFQPFQQADDSTTRKYGGSGLGLAISRQLVEMMGGQIVVNSVVNQGSTFLFTVVLEMAEAPARDGSLTPAARQDLRHLRVLVVEDQPVNRLVITGMLERLGIVPLLAENGREALDLMAQQLPLDLVFMDCEMPVMDGYEATRQLRRREAEEGRAPLPVIALTAHAMPEHKQRCMDAGMNDHLSKPLTLAALMAALQRWGRPAD